MSIRTMFIIRAGISPSMLMKINDILFDLDHSFVRVQGATRLMRCISAFFRAFGRESSERNFSADTCSSDGGKGAAGKFSKDSRAKLRSVHLLAIKSGTMKHVESISSTSRDFLFFSPLRLPPSSVSGMDDKISSLIA